MKKGALRRIAQKPFGLAFLRGRELARLSRQFPAQVVDKTNEEYLIRRTVMSEDLTEALKAFEATSTQKKEIQRSLNTLRGLTISVLFDLINYDRKMASDPKRRAQKSGSRIVKLLASGQKKVYSKTSAKQRFAIFVFQRMMLGDLLRARGLYSPDALNRLATTEYVNIDELIERFNDRALVAERRNERTAVFEENRKRNEPYRKARALIVKHARTRAQKSALKHELDALWKKNRGSTVVVTRMEERLGLRSPSGARDAQRQSPVSAQPQKATSRKTSGAPTPRQAFLNAARRRVPNIVPIQQKLNAIDPTGTVLEPEYFEKLLKKLSEEPISDIRTILGWIK